MYGAGQYYIEDDDDVPPGFEGRRGRHGPQQAEHPPGNSSYVAPQYTHAPHAQQHSTSTAAHQQPSYSSNGYQQHQPLYQQPAPPSANGHGYSNPNMGPSYQQQLGRMGSGEMAAAAMPRALGGTRQFQRALSGSVAAAQQQPSRPSAPPQRPQSGPKSPRSAAAANPRFAAPDYGEYGNDSDGDYGATPNSMRRRNSSGKLHPHRGSSVSPGPGYHSSSSSPGRPMAGSSSYGRPAAPLPPAAAAAAVAAAAAAASSTAAPSPSASQQAAAAAGAGNSSNSAPGRPPVAASPEPEPDYGEYDVNEEYGQEARGGGRRRQTRQGGGGSSSSRPRSSSRSGRGPAPEMAVAAARQALAGIAPPPSGRTPRNARVSLCVE
jgi:Meckel syndrome type 1 protein